MRAVISLSFRDEVARNLIQIKSFATRQDQTGHPQSKGDPVMTPNEVWFLTLAIGAATVFAITLAYVSSR